MFFLFALFFIAAARAEVEWSGYYKNILMDSTTLYPLNEDYQLDLNRLRIKARGDLSDSVSFNVEYDNEILLGDYLQTQQFQLQKLQPTNSYFDLEDVYADLSDAYARHSIYRAYIDVALHDIDLRIGRQRIAWGTAQLWNPMDILNPLNPVQLEREERPGVDALMLDLNTDALSRITLVAVKHDDSSSEAIRWRSHIKDIDLSVMAGTFREEDVIGLDFSTQLGQTGFRGEFTQTDSITEGKYNRSVIGIDYTFSNTLSLNLEYYYNGQGFDDKADYQLLSWLTGEIQSLAKNYLGVYLAYDITPLFKLKNVLIINRDDDSYFFFPSLIYSVTENTSISTGIQLFKGNGDSEYGLAHDLYYIELQWFY